MNPDDRIALTAVVPVEHAVWITVESDGTFEIQRVIFESERKR